MHALSAWWEGLHESFRTIALIPSILLQAETPELSIDPENFGDFFTALFSLWQISTGDDWSLIVRPLFDKTGQPMLVAIFFVSFQLCITFTMINVFVCVLVDEFSGAGGSGGNEVLTPHANINPRRSKFIALLSRLANCIDLEHFDATLDDIWVPPPLVLIGHAALLTPY